MTLNAERTAVIRRTSSGRAGHDPATPPGAARQRAGSQRPASHRDASIDAARAACLVVVFALHAMMVGVSVGPDGPVLENALEGWAWFAPATWVVQIMPLFFVIGGFAGWSSWQRMQQRGQSASDFVRGRLGRLVRPAIALVVVVATTLAALAVAGMPAEIVATAGYRIGQPLWFLAVYIACSSLVPVMAKLHTRHPLVVVIALLAVVVAVDVVRMTTGIDAIGFANLLAVWLLVQQGGFFLADGTIERMPRARRLGVAAAALGVLLLLTVAGPYSPDLLMNLNPPTVCLVVLGVAQLALFSLVRPALRRWAERARPSRVIAGFGEWGMTLYLWHMPAFVALAGVLLVLHDLVGFSLPVPLTDEWWGSRPLWLIAAALGTAALVRAFARFERSPERRPTRFIMPLGVAVPAGAAGIGVPLVIGFAPVPALVALALLGLALAGSRSAGCTPAPSAWTHRVAYSASQLSTIQRACSTRAAEPTNSASVIIR